MSYHIVNIDSADAVLACENGQLVCVDEQKNRRSIPLEDVASIIITGFRSTITNQLIIEAAANGIALIVCEHFKPVSIMLPVDRSTDTSLSRAQVSLHTRQRATLWRRTVRAKVKNQLLLSEHIAPGLSATKALRKLFDGSREPSESVAARYHWRAFSIGINDKDFRRNRSAGGINSMLNYGYAVLLSVVIQKLLGVGIDPTFGISHAIREHATPLAYDLMEPFRPYVDWQVIECFSKQACKPRDVIMDKETRGLLTELMVKEVFDGVDRLELRMAVEERIRTFRKAVMEHKPSLYKPWILKASKWDGC